MIRAQGISGSDVYLITPDTSENSGAQNFLVKKWKFGKHVAPGSDGVCNTVASGDDVQVTSDGNSPGSGKPCVSPGEDGTLDTTNPAKDDVKKDGILSGAGTAYDYVLESGTWEPSGSNYGKLWGDASNQKGVPAQNNLEPPEFFGNHWIVKFNGEFYDPSYGIGGGKNFNSEKKYENQAISGIQAAGFIDGRVVEIAKKNNTSTQELEFDNLTDSD